MVEADRPPAQRQPPQFPPDDKVALMIRGDPEAENLQLRIELQATDCITPSSLLHWKKAQ